MYKRILAPIDGSDASQRGIEEATALARDQDAGLHFLYVIDGSMATVDPSVFLAYDELREGLRSTGKSVLASAQQLAAERGVTATTILRETTSHRAASVVVAEVKKAECDLIVMGTHGRRGFSHLVLGSVAEEVIKTSPVPVLLVRPTE